MSFNKITLNKIENNFQKSTDLEKKDIKAKAATTIQKWVRGWLARKPFLPTQYFNQYLTQCRKAASYYFMPEAEGGKTHVYLPKDLPDVVLKHSGRKDAIKRFHQMRKVRSILDSKKAPISLSRKHDCVGISLWKRDCRLM